MATRTSNFVGTQELTIKSNSQHNDLTGYLTKLQEDSKRIFMDMVQYSNWGYRVEVDDVVTEHPPEECAANRLSFVGGNKEMSDKLLEYIESIAGLRSCKDLASGYGIFCNQYKPTNGVRADSADAIKLRKVIGGKSPSEVKLPEEYVEKLDIIRSSCSEKIGNFMFLERQAQGPDAPKSKVARANQAWGKVWKEACKVTGLGAKGSFTGTMVMLRDNNVLPNVAYPNNKAYCTALYDMVSSQLKSWYQCFKAKTEERASNKAAIDSFREKNPDLMVAMDNFLSDLADKEVYVRRFQYLKTAIMAAANCKQNPLVVSNKTGRAKVIHDLLMEDKNDILLKSDLRLVKRSLTIHKMGKKYDEQSPYNFLHRSEKFYPVPFGKTGLNESFSLSLKGRNLVVSINKFAAFECEYSNYFHFDSLEAVGDSYKVTFRHKKKNIRKRHGVVDGESRTIVTQVGPSEFSEPKVAFVKQIGIRLYKNKYRLRLPFTIEHDPHLVDVENFFVSANKEKSLKHAEKLKDSYIAVACDLGIRKQSLVTAKLTKDGPEGHFGVLDYGTGRFITKPTYIGMADEEWVSVVREIRSDINAIKDAMEDVKYASANRPTGSEEALSVPEETKIALSRISAVPNGNNFNDYRKQIAKSVFLIKKRVGVLNAKNRKCGGTNVGNALQVLSINKEYRSLLHAYTNLHTKKGMKCSHVSHKNSFVNTRYNTAKKIASMIAAYAKKMQADIVFLEDLRKMLSLDNSARFNRLLALFAPGQLMECLLNAFRKAGITVVLCCPKYSSRTHIILGIRVYRPGGGRDSDLPEEIKIKLRSLSTHSFFKEAGVMKSGDSDGFGCFSVMMIGCNHSVFQTDLRIGKNGKIATSFVSEDGDTQAKERVRRFLQERGLEDTYFIPNPDGTLTLTNEWSESVAKSTTIYHDADGFYTEAGWYKKERKIRDELIKLLPTLDAEGMEIDLSPESIGTCKAFQI